MSSITERSKVQRGVLVERILAIIESGDLDWQKCWAPGTLSPYNPITHTRYRGVNRCWLGFIAVARGYKDSRWLTFQQIKKEGYRLAKGSRGAHVEKWGTYFKVAPGDSGGDSHDPDTKTHLVLQKMFTVFNGDLIEGLDPIESHTPIGDIGIYTAADTIIDTLEAQYLESQDDDAQYIPYLDLVVVPSRDRFDTTEDFLATLCHEAAHSTGSDQRLNRNTTGSLHSSEYAREELIAELASLFIQDELAAEKYGHVVENSAAYIASWIKALKETPQILFTAMSAAEAACDYLMERYYSHEALCGCMS